MAMLAGINGQAWPSTTPSCSTPPHLEAGAGVATQLEAGAAAQQRVAGAVGGEERGGTDRHSSPVGPVLLGQLAVACSTQGST